MINQHIRTSCNATAENKFHRLPRRTLDPAVSMSHSAVKTPDENRKGNSDALAKPMPVAMSLLPTGTWKKVQKGPKLRSGKLSLAGRRPARTSPWMAAVF